MDLWREAGKPVYTIVGDETGEAASVVYGAGVIVPIAKELELLAAAKDTESLG